MSEKQTIIHWPPRWGWILFILWIGVIALMLIIGVVALDTVPVDYNAYQIAADRVGQGVSPYNSAAENQAIWREINRLAADLDPSDVATAEFDLPSGPYIYSPILALFIEQLRVNAVIFIALVCVSVIGFAILWIYETAMGEKRSLAWLLLIALSWDVVASVGGANIELILLFLALISTWLLWHDRGLMAAAPIAFMILIKPFYSLLIAGFGLLLLVRTTEWRRPFQTLMMAAFASLALIGLEIWRWPAWLRQESFVYLQNAAQHQWIALPVIEQTPMSVWNRTPLQAMINWGVPVSQAQLLALGLWVILLGVLLLVVWRRPLSFPMLFASTFVLFMWGRPVSWTLPYLDIVVLLAIWPFVNDGWPRRLLVLGAASLALSHWVALGRSVAAINAHLFTLQTATVPWETLFVLPTAGLLILWAVLQIKRVPHAQ